MSCSRSAVVGVRPPLLALPDRPVLARRCPLISPRAHSRQASPQVSPWVSPCRTPRRQARAGSSAGNVGRPSWAHHSLASVPEVPQSNVHSSVSTCSNSSPFTMRGSATLRRSASAFGTSRNSPPLVVQSLKDMSSSVARGRLRARRSSVDNLPQRVESSMEAPRYAKSAAAPSSCVNAPKPYPVLLNRCAQSAPQASGDQTKMAQSMSPPVPGPCLEMPSASSVDNLSQRVEAPIEASRHAKSAAVPTCWISAPKPLYPVLLNRCAQTECQASEDQTKLAQSMSPPMPGPCLGKPSLSCRLKGNARAFTHPGVDGRGKPDTNEVKVAVPVVRRPAATVRHSASDSHEDNTSAMAQNVPRIVEVAFQTLKEAMSVTTALTASMEQSISGWQEATEPDPEDSPPDSPPPHTPTASDSSSISSPSTAVDDLALARRLEIPNLKLSAQQVGHCMLDVDNTSTPTLEVCPLQSYRAKRSSGETPVVIGTVDDSTFGVEIPTLTRYLIGRRK